MGRVEYFDIVIVGSGAAGLSAALAAASPNQEAPKRVLILEKASTIGGSTAMSGGGIWIPNNHHMKRLGAQDTREKALTYIRAVSPEGWQQTEDSLWTAFVDHGPEMIRFVEKHSPTRFNPNREPDPYAEAPG